MTLNEQYLIQLRDCFTAGYTMPQFCIDNNIKKTLIVAIDGNYWQFLWEMHVQFQYDKRISASFALIHGEIKQLNFEFFSRSTQTLYLKNINEFNLDNYDKVIILSVEGAPKNNFIYLEELADYFFHRTYSEIPLLHFIQKNPGVKIIQINYPSLNRNADNSEAEKKFLHRKIILSARFAKKLKRLNRKAKLSLLHMIFSATAMKMFINYWKRRNKK